MAIVITSYYKPKLGGLCKRLFRAIEALLDAGHEVHYVSIERFPINHDRCFFHKFPWPAKKSENLVFWFVFHVFCPWLILYHGWRCKVTHAFAFSSTYGLFMQPLRLLRKTPLSIFLRADLVENHKLKNRSIFITQSELFIEGLSIYKTYLYGVSQTLTSNVIARHSFLRPKFFEAFRNNVECDKEFSPLYPIHRPIKVACVGVLEHRKNQELAIRSMSDFRKKDIHLYLFGMGPDEEKLITLSKELKLNDQVSFMGWVSSEKIWPEIDVLLMPSFHEGAPNSVLEAMSYGVPVIASDIPEHREILPKRNLCSITDIDEWKECLRSIIEEPNYALMQLRKNQIQSANELMFDWNSEVRKRILCDINE